MPDISKITLPSGTTYDIKDAVAREAISGGVSFIIAWSGTGTPVVADIPAGVVVTYQGQSYTGTLAATAAVPGAFYLVKSASTPSSETLDIYDEYVPVGTDENKIWEKIGDTVANISDLVKNVTLDKQTTNFVTGYSSPTTDTVIGSGATFSVTQPTITVTPSTTYLGASATGANTSWNSKDQVTAVTGYSDVTTDTFVKSVSAETGKNLVTTTVTGVSGSTSASKATAATSQTTATGSGTASSSNTDWLKGVSVSNENLTFNAVTPDTQTTTQFTFADVTVPKAAATATTVATGATSTTGTGDAVVTGVTIGSSATAITGLGNPDTDTVIGSNATFTVTQPTITLASNTASATGRVSVATGISSATATNGAVAWKSKDEVTALTGLGTASTAAALNDTTTITVTKVQ